MPITIRPRASLLSRFAQAIMLSNAQADLEKAKGEDIRNQRNLQNIHGIAKGVGQGATNYMDIRIRRKEAERRHQMNMERDAARADAAMQRTMAAQAGQDRRLESSQAFTTDRDEAQGDRVDARQESTQDRYDARMERRFELEEMERQQRAQEMYFQDYSSQLFGTLDDPSYRLDPQTRTVLGELRNDYNAVMGSDILNPEERATALAPMRQKILSTPIPKKPEPLTIDRMEQQGRLRQLEDGSYLALDHNDKISYFGKRSSSGKDPNEERFKEQEKVRSEIGKQVSAWVLSNQSDENGNIPAGWEPNGTLWSQKVNQQTTMEMNRRDLSRELQTKSPDELFMTYEGLLSMGAEGGMFPDMGLPDELQQDFWMIRNHILGLGGEIAERLKALERTFSGTPSQDQ